MMYKIAFLDYERGQKFPVHNKFTQPSLSAPRELGPGLLK